MLQESLPYLRRRCIPYGEALQQIGNQRRSAASDHGRRHRSGERWQARRLIIKPCGASRLTLILFNFPKRHYFNVAVFRYCVNYVRGLKRLTLERTPVTAERLACSLAPPCRFPLHNMHIHNIAIRKYMNSKAIYFWHETC